LGEHFENYAVVAIDSDGNLIWEYNNWMIGVMLMERATECIEEDENPVVVEINEEDNDDDGWNEVPAMP
jgi:hypothetical protein